MTCSQRNNVAHLGLPTHLLCRAAIVLPTSELCKRDVRTATFATSTSLTPARASHARAHGAALANTAAIIQIKNAASPKISMIASVRRDANVAGRRCECDVNSHNSLVKFSFNGA